jgi:hypothetical protein
MISKIFRGGGRAEVCVVALTSSDAPFLLAAKSLVCREEPKAQRQLTDHGFSIRYFGTNPTC